MHFSRFISSWFPPLGIWKPWPNRMNREINFLSNFLRSSKLIRISGNATATRKMRTRSSNNDSGCGLTRRDININHYFFLGLLIVSSKLIYWIYWENRIFHSFNRFRSRVELYIEATYSLEILESICILNF